MFERTIKNESRKANASNSIRVPSVRGVQKFIALGRYGDAVRLLNSSGVHPTSPDGSHILKEKHPVGQTCPHFSQQLRSSCWRLRARRSGDTVETANSLPGIVVKG